MSDGKVKILILTADPPTLSPLQLGKEVREITASIHDGTQGDQFEVVPELAVRRRDLIKLLRKHRPRAVHFSGHGSEKGAIFFISDDDKPLPLRADALKTIFAEFKDTVRLVFLNACYTRTEVEAIAEEVDCAVGTDTGISDRAAITFAATFYNELASGSTIGKAFSLGKAQLMCEEIEAEANLNIFAKQGIDYHQIRLVDPNDPSTTVEVITAPEIETERTGRVYISSVSSRIAESRLIAAAMRDRGIPLCEEALVEDLHLTDDAITKLLRSPGTASAVVALTPEAVESRSVNTVELPAMLERIGHANGFFIVAAALSNFDLGETGACLRSKGVPLLRVTKGKATATEAAKIAKLVLEQRIAAIHSLDPGEPIRLEFYTKIRPPFIPGTALLIDWTERFKQRYAAPEDWDRYLLPALRDIVQAIETQAPGRALQADGRLSLPAAVALGCAFVQPKHIEVRWAQHTIGRPDQFWKIDVPGESCSLKIETGARQPDGKDIAVLVSVTNNVEPDFESSLADLPLSLRAIVRAWMPQFGRDKLSTPGQAATAAADISTAIQAATNTYGPSCVHLFMAVPAGLAMMIGQLVNTIVPLQTYDLDSTESGRRYRPAALLKPCG